MRYCQENKKECALAHSRAEARLPRQPSTLAPSAHPRGAFLSYGNEVSYTIKKLPPGSFPSDGSFLSALFSQQTENVPLFHFVHRFYKFKAVLSGNYSPS